MVKAYVFYYLCCFYRIFTVGCMDGITMFNNTDEMIKLLGFKDINDFDAYYNECIEEMLPFTLSERPVKETNHENERFQSCT